MGRQGCAWRAGRWIARWIAGAVVVVGPALAGGAEGPPRALSLDEALAQVGATSEEILLAGAELERARQEVAIARSAFLPTLRGDIAYLRTFESRFSVLNPEAEGGMPAPRPPSCDEFAPDPEASTEDRLALLERAIGCTAGAAPFGDLEELPFGRDHQLALSLEVSWNLFRGGADLARWRMTRAGLEAARLDLSATKAQLLLDVTSAYYDALLAEDVLRIAEEGLAQAEDTLRQVEREAAEGLRAEFDLVRARVARDNARPAVVEARRDRVVARARLHDLIELPHDPPVELTTRLTVTPEELDEASAVAWGHGEEPTFDPAVPRVRRTVPVPVAIRRDAVERARLGVVAAERALDAALGARVPSLTISSLYSRVAFPEESFPTWGDFFTDFTVGATVSVPIFTGGRLLAQERQARAAVVAARARLALIEEAASRDTLDAMEALRAGVSNWRATTGTLEQADRALELAALRYREGISTLLELQDTRLQRSRAAVERSRAARELEVARARVRLLPHLPVPEARVLAAGAAPMPVGGSGQEGVPPSAGPPAGAVDQAAGVPWEGAGVGDVLGPSAVPGVLR